VNHIPDRTLSAYLAGAARPADETWATEGHLEACALCRSRLAELSTPDDLLTTVWTGLEPQLTTAPAPVSSRLRALGSWATPVMLPWLVTLLLVTIVAVVLSGRIPGTTSVLAVFAPVLPVLGVAASWSRGIDPAYEVTAASPRAGLYLVLRRTTAVLVAVLPVLLIAGWLTGTSVGMVLLPSLAFTTGTLALGALIGVTRAAGAFVVAWLGVLVAPALARGTSFALQPETLPVWGGIFVLTAVVVVLRRSAFTRLSAHH
jgi:hypothetical protein